MMKIILTFVLFIWVSLGNNLDLSFDKKPGSQKSNILSEKKTLPQSVVTFNRNLKKHDVNA